MPKKVAPFWAFYRLYESSQSKKGRKLSASEMHEEASKFWEDLNEEDRAYFVENAKEETRQRREELWRRHDTNLRCNERPQSSCIDVPETHLSLGGILERNTEQLMAKIHAHSGGVRAMEFTFIHVNNQLTIQHFNTSTKAPSDLRPLEISLCRFSIEKGIISRWHGMLNPGMPRMPRNQENRARFVCNQTHRIPLEGLQNAARNIRSFWNSATKFYDGTILVAATDFAETVGALIFILQRCKLQVVPLIVDAKSLMSCIKQSCRSAAVLSEAAIEPSDMRNPEEDELDMSCSYHGKGDGWRYCTLLQVTKMAFEFSRAVSSAFEVEPLIAGLHTPIGRNSMPVFEYKESPTFNGPREASCGDSGSGRNDTESNIKKS